MKRKKKLQPLQKQLVHLLLIFVICVLSIIVWSISDYIKLQNKNLENTLELYAGHLAQTARQSYTSYENIAYSAAYNTLVQDYIQESLSASLQFAQQYVEAKFVSCRYHNYRQRWQLDFSNCISITV